uniref:Uncharacterized protein n=1 Tax=Anguilla anguilla TaxID=7936 RepID=A0A0E9PTZ1_ANGAN
MDWAPTSEFGEQNMLVCELTDKAVAMIADIKMALKV